MTDVLLSLGSNIDPDANMRAAIEALTALPESTVHAVSSTYVTPAIGPDGRPSGQADFYNAAVHIDTGLTAVDLRTRLRAIEAARGRVRSTDKFAPRPLDIDIAFYGQSVLEIDGTIIPDPEIDRQAHMIVPLAEIAPTWRLPRSPMTLGQLAGRLAPEEMEFEQR